MTDGAVLPLPQEHQADHNHSCYGHRDHQQANQCAAPEAEVLSQRAVGLLKVEWVSERERGSKETDQTTTGLLKDMIQTVQVVVEHYTVLYYCDNNDIVHISVSPLWLATTATSLSTMMKIFAK